MKILLCHILPPVLAWNIFGRNLSDFVRNLKIFNRNFIYFAASPKKFVAKFKDFRRVVQKPYLALL